MERIKHRRIVCIGDSLTVGARAGVGDTYTGARARSYPSRLAAILNARTDSLFGAGYRDDCALSVFDPRVDHGHGWVADLDERAFSLGGPAFRGEFGEFVFRPEGRGDVVDLILAGGPVRLCADGRPIGQEVRQDGSVRKASFGLGGLCLAPALTVAPLDGPALLIGMEFKDSSAGETVVLNVGVTGCLVGGWARTDRELLPRRVLPLLEPDLCIVCLGVNDMASDMEPDLFRGAFGETLRGIRQSGAEVIVVAPTQCAPVVIKIERQARFAKIMRNVAGEQGYRFMSLPERLGDYAEMEVRGWMSDAFHPNAAGYQAIAEVIAYVEAANVNLESLT